MSTAPLFSFGVVGQNLDNTSFSVFQPLNNPNATTLVTGNFFLGLQAYIAVAIPMGELLGVHRGAHVTGAGSTPKVGMVATKSWTAGGTISINAMLDDSPRGEPTLLDRRLVWKPRLGFGPAWRRNAWGVNDQRLEDTGGTPFLDTGLGTVGSFGLRTILDKRERVGHLFTVPAGPSWSVARAILELRKTGAPIGSVEVAIQTSVSDGFGHLEPDGVDLAVSATVTVASIPAGPSAVTFAFAPDVVLPPGSYWTVLRFVTPYPISLVNYIVWMESRVFLGVGGSHYTLNATRFDLGNYPGHVDVHFDTLAREVGPSIIWNPPAAVAGNLMVTPDLSPLVEEVVRNSGHETTDPICFTFRTVGETRTYRFASNSNPTYSAPSFSSQFTRRDTAGGSI